MTAAPYPLYDQHANLWPLVAPLASYEDEMREWVALIEDGLGARLHGIGGAGLARI